VGAERPTEEAPLQKDPASNPVPDDREPGVPPHEPPVEEDEDRVDEDARESFPSSDPPATGGPGV
jgi:hypothetical protein